MPIHNRSLEINHAVLQKLVMLKTRRGFSYVHPEFLSDVCFLWLQPGPLKELLSCDEIFSSFRCRKICTQTFFPVEDFFMKQTYHVFEFQNPETECRICGTSFCGFMLKSSPGKLESPDSFSIELVTELEEITVKMASCSHHKLIKPDSIHIVFEVKSVSDNIFIEHGIYTQSWEGKPYITEDGQFCWGVDTFRTEAPIRCDGCGIAQFTVFRTFPHNLLFSAHIRTFCNFLHISA